MRSSKPRLAAVVLAIAALATSSAAALASNGAATPFKVAYDNESGSWDCSGARVVNQVSVKDSETCIVTGDTSELIPGVYTGDPYGDLPWFANAQWGSDYDDLVAVSWTVTIWDDGDGSFTVEAVAYF